MTDRLVVHWPRLGPYHLARLRGAHECFDPRGVTVVALEVAGLDRTYGWKKETGDTPFERLTVFPDRYYEELRPRELRSRLFETLDALDPTAVAINGYAFKDSRICLDWCVSRKRKAILMTETRAADSSRSIIRETAKRLLLRRFAAAVCGGTLHREYLISLGMPAHRIFTKYDVVDNEYFGKPPGDPRNGLLPGLDTESPFFLASNRFLPRKNLGALLTAYRDYRSRLPDGWRLVLLGSGEEESRLRKRVEEEHLPAVTFAGFRQIEDLPFYYHAASCFIHPALNEPWGLVVNEAMASGLPVIVSRGVGCAPDLVAPGENGFLFDPRQPAELARLMTDITAAPERKLRMGRRSSELIRDYTLQEFGLSLWNAFMVPDQGYRIVYFGSRKFLAYRDNPFGRKLERISRIETFTVRRRLALGTVRASILTGLDKLWFRRTKLDDPAFLSADITRALRQVRETLGQMEVDYMFAWPAEINRKRTYAYAFDETADTCAFIKLSEAGEADLLRRGFGTLQSLAKISHPRFKFPRALSFGSSGDVCFHVTECVPMQTTVAGDGFGNISAEECIESYGGPIVVVRPEELEQLTWMQRFWETIGSGSHFAMAVKQDQQFGAKCRRVHGDLTIANLIPSGNALWIIDWELSDPTGPSLTDVVTFFLGQRQRELVKNPMRILQQFRNRFIDNQSEEEQRDARLALAFLYGVNSGLGKGLVGAWNQAPT